jgi:acyl-[acyl-carrier-protein]-phospholipid O-acyltransferase/long-chain-fatty-acid--[acyl-carrier-protein] ligase
MSSNSSNIPKDLRILGEAYLPEGGFLLIPSRLSFSDLLHLERFLVGRELEYLIDSDGIYDQLLVAHMEKPDVKATRFHVEESDRNDDQRREIHTAVSKGKIIIFVPSPISAHVGSLTRVPSEVLRALLAISAQTCPLFVDKPNEMRLSIEDPIHPATIFAFGKPLGREAITLPNYQEHLLAAGQTAFDENPILDSHLGYAIIQGLKKHGSSKLVDGLDGSTLTYDKVLAAAIALSKHIRQETEKDRVGIILPAGKGGLIANLAVLIAGKIPVNLNFTSATASIESSMRQAEIDRFITADPFVRKMNSFPWPPNKQIIYLERVLPTLKKKMIKWAILSKICSARILSTLTGTPRKGGNKEAVLLFTSGSSGEPKGVVLTHRNLLANVKQFGARIELKTDDKVLGCLPLFHSFGCTVTQWYPVIEGLGIVTYPSPLEQNKLADLVEEHGVSLFLSTPTFLRGYLKKVAPEKLKSLKLAITGAEKLPAKIAEAFKERFGHDVMEGYGLTETSPVSNFNLPNLSLPNDGSDPRTIPSYRPGSVGQMVAGIAVRITDPGTDQPLPLNATGIIWMRGANVFGGYLKLPMETDAVIQDGWFRTGDIGRMDEDGFLFIEGRVSRFSKIGGEMVPHEKIEDEINKAFGVDADDQRHFAVVGVPDEAKGEALVLISKTLMGEQARIDMRYTLLERGVPALWIPKRVVHVEEIPVLASGKLDIKACENAANSHGV